MSEPADERGREPEPPAGPEESAEGTYPLARPEPAAGPPEPKIYPGYQEPRDAPPPDTRESRQYSLVELFLVMTGVAVLLGFVGLLPGGYRGPLGAGLLGLIVLGLMLFLAVVKPERLIFWIAWWVLLLLYLTIALPTVLYGPPEP